MAAADFRHPSAGAYSSSVQVQAWLLRVGEAAQAAGEATVRHHTALLQTRVKAGASGRPGPRAPTGDYRRTINRRVVSLRGIATGTVGTNAPQARRLEYGFVGTDRLGRVYDQPPYPHFGPAARVTLVEFGLAMSRVVGV